MLVIYRLLESFDLTLLPWANATATLSGIALGLVTPWGLLRYYWVAIKLVIAVTISVVAFGFLHNALVSASAHQRLNAGGGAITDHGALPAVVLAGFTFVLLNLDAAVLLSLYRPGGKTSLVRGQRMRAATPVTDRV